MAHLTRCDECKKLSDEPGIGYVGRDHAVKHYKDVVMTIRTYKDLCRDCVKKLVANHSISESEDD